MGELDVEKGGDWGIPRPGQTVAREGVTIHGEVNWPGTDSGHASQLYSRNVSALLAHLAKDGALALDLEDEITKGALITNEGQVVHVATKAALEKA